MLLKFYITCLTFATNSLIEKNAPCRHHSLADRRDYTRCDIFEVNNGLYYLKEHKQISL